MFFMESYIPDVVVHMRQEIEDANGLGGCVIEGPSPFDWVTKTTSELFTGKKVIIFGLPGAFTPTCSNNQLPGFDSMFEDFSKLGVDEIWCTSVNDAFVMNKWAKDLGITNVKMLPDGNGEFADKLGYLVDKSNLGFGKRSWRYAMYVDNLAIKQAYEEDHYMPLCPVDPYEVSDPTNVFNKLKEHLNGE